MYLTDKCSDFNPLTESTSVYDPVNGLLLCKQLALLHLALPCYCNCFPQKKSTFALPFS